MNYVTFNVDTEGTSRILFSADSPVEIKPESSPGAELKVTTDPNIFMEVTG
jgi:hypothetical protein